jgi:hypothetical protein
MLSNDDEKTLVLHEVYQGYATITFHLQKLAEEMEQGNSKNLNSTIKKITKITNRELKQLEGIVK